MVSLMQVLSTNLPPNCTFHRPEGGYYVWLQLPKGTDAADFCQFSLENYDATAFAGKFFSESKSNCMRMAVAFHEKEQLVQAAELICKALHEYLAKTKPA